MNASVPAKLGIRTPEVVDAFALHRNGATEESAARLSALLDRIPDDLSSWPGEADAFAVEAVGYFLHVGRPARAAALCRAFEGARFADRDIGILFALAAAVASMTEGALPGIRPSAGRRLVLALPLWGEPFASFWAEAGAASLATAEARAFFAAFDAVELLIFTDPASLARVKTGAAAVEGGPVSARYLNISAILDRFRDVDLGAMTAAHWTALAVARARGADALLLFADMLFLPSSLPALARLGPDPAVVFSLDPHLSLPGWHELRRRYAGFDDWPRADDADFARFIVRHLDARDLEASIDEVRGTLSRRPERLLALDEGGAEIRAARPQPFFLSAAALERIWCPFPMPPDAIMVDCATASTGGLEICRFLSPADGFLPLSVELRPKGPTPVRMPAPRPGETFRDRLADWLRLNHTAGASRRWALGHALRLGDPAPSILADLPTLVSADGDDPLSAYLGFSNRIVLPAYRRRFPA